jgi:hypothetical protein
MVARAAATAAAVDLTRAGSISEPVLLREQVSKIDAGAARISLRRPVSVSQ